MRIIVSGTPGTGKTVLAKKLAKAMKTNYLSLSEWIKKEKVYAGKDGNSYVVDIESFLLKLERLVKKEKHIVIDGHLSHFLPKRYVDVCFITKCPLDVLNSRLKKRKYSPAKLRENLDCEIFDVCCEEAKENGHNPIVVWTHTF